MSDNHRIAYMRIIFSDFLLNLIIKKAGLTQFFRASFKKPYKIKYKKGHNFKIVSELFIIFPDTSCIFPIE